MNAFRRLYLRFIYRGYRAPFGFGFCDYCGQSTRLWKNGNVLPHPATTSPFFEGYCNGSNQEAQPKVMT